MELLLETELLFGSIKWGKTMKWNQLLSWKNTKPFLGSYIDWSHPLAQGLVGCWLFNEGSGNLVFDLSLHGNSGTLINGPTWVAGRTGLALEFDGEDDYVEVADSTSLDLPEELTVIANFKTNVIPSSGVKTIVSKDTNYEFHINSNGEIWWWWKDSDETQHTLIGTKTIQTGVYYQVAIVYSKFQGKARIYLNGDLDVEGSFTQSLMLNTNPFQIGNDQGHTGRFFDGLIDEVRIYNRALSPSEIAYLHSEPYCFILNPIMDYVIEG